MPELFLPRRLPTVATACERAEALVREAGWPGPDVVRVALALGEAVGNAVEHGGSEWVRLDLALDGDTLTACVDDGGGGPSAARLEAPRLPEDPFATSGRGLFILQRVADEVRLDEDGGLCVTIRSRA